VRLLYVSPINALSRRNQLVHSTEFTLAIRGLGTAGIDRNGTPITGRAVQRHRLALLFLLARAGSSGVPRDVLIRLLWPENPPARGRHLLSEALYVVRKEFGEALICAEGEVLRLAEWVGYDVAEFEAAVEAGELERAAALYTGAFLDGFVPPAGAELERWIEAERQRVEAIHHRVLESLAERARISGDLDAAVEWWRRLAVQDPFSSRIAAGLVRALAARGDRAAALRHATLHAQMLRDEYESAPPPEFRRLVEELRAESEPEPAPTSAPLPSPVPLAADASEPDEWEGVAPAPPPALALPQGGVWSLARRWVLGLAVGLALLVGVRVARDVWSAPESNAGARLAVLPFAVRGDSGIEYLGDGIVSLLSLGLAGVEGAEIVDPRRVLDIAARERALREPESDRRIAERLEAERYVVGEVTGVGGRVRIAAALYSRSDPSHSVRTASVEGPAAEVLKLVDRLAMELLLSTERRAVRLVGSASDATASLDAFKAFLQGEDSLRAARYGAAVAAFERATKEDTLFALAYYRLATAAEWAIQPELARRSLLRAAQLRGRLAERDRVLVDAALAWHEGRAAEAEQLYRRALSEHRDDVEAWFQLGEVLYHGNPLRGRPLEESRAAWEQVLALDTAHLPAMVHLVRVAAREGRRDEALRLRDRIAVLAPESEQAMETTALCAFAFGTADEQARALASLGRASAGSLSYLVSLLAGFIEAPRPAESVARLLTQGGRAREERAHGHILLAYLAAAQGRWRAAEAFLARAEPDDPAGAAEAAALLALSPAAPDGSRLLPRIRARFAATEVGADAGTVSPYLFLDLHHEVRPQVRAFLLGLAEARFGDPAAAERHARALVARPDSGATAALDGAAAALLRAELKHRNGNPDAALRALTDTEVSIPYQVANRSPFFARTHARFLRAELLRETGRPEQALAWYSTMGLGSSLDFLWTATAHRRQAEIYEALGRRAEARLHRARAERWTGMEGD
jgi:DNA-binding SARP family transcriptional activator/TolB-like protein